MQQPWRLEAAIHPTFRDRKTTTTTAMIITKTLLRITSVSTLFVNVMLLLFQILELLLLLYRCRGTLNGIRPEHKLPGFDSTTVTIVLVEVIAAKVEITAIFKTGKISEQITKQQVSANFYYSKRWTKLSHTPQLVTLRTARSRTRGEHRMRLPPSLLLRQALSFSL